MQEQRNELRVAWAAGLFEGEGCWNVYVRKSGKKQMQARLGMTDRDVVEEFAEIVGFGHMRSHHTPSAQARGEKPMYQWYTHQCSNVRTLVALFLPYLGERRRAKALEVLAMGADIRPYGEERTHCPQGHPLSGDNLVLEPIKRGSRDYVARRCKTCRRDQARERMRRRARSL